MRAHFFATCLVLVLSTSSSVRAQTIAAPAPLAEPGTVVLTLDACGGAFDWQLAHLLVEHNVPATLFVTRRWLNTNSAASAYLREHSDLFTIENHGADHKALVLGSRRGPFGVPAVETKRGLVDEVAGGAEAIRLTYGVQSHWFRGATAQYSPEALEWLTHAGWGVAGYSVALDDGATLPAALVARRALSAHPGDVLLGHINKPLGQTAEGLTKALPVMLSHGVHFGHLQPPAAPAIH